MGRAHHLPASGMTSQGNLVTISEGKTGRLTQLAGWDRFTPACDAALRQNGLSLPLDYRQPVRGERKVAWRTAPDRVLVSSAAALDVESSADLAVLDLSDARIRLVVEGPGAADLLARVMALDFSQDAFPVGTFAQGALHHVGVLVDRRAADGFDLLIPTTWAGSLTGLMIDHLGQAPGSGAVA